MKIVKLPLLGLSLVILVASCKKDDFKEEAGTNVAVNALSVNEADTAGWRSSSQWETADQETFLVRYFTIEDANITADVADNGLVLLFKKAGNQVNALPFEEGTAGGDEEAATSDEDAGSNANYWYHQVTEGSLLVSCDVYGAATPDVASSFKYFVITPEKLQSLQTDGYTTEELMSLSYAEVATLLKGVK